MADRIEIVHPKVERIEIVGPTARRIEPEEFAAALGAEPVGEKLPEGTDLISLAHLGNELLQRRRSKDTASLGAAALSRDDLAALSDIAATVERATGSRSSLGQLAHALRRMDADTLKNLIQG